MISTRSQPALEDHRQLFHQAVTQADREAAWAAVEAAAGLGADAAGVLAEVVAPALRQIGTDWAEGRGSIAVEHAATQTTLWLLDRAERLWSARAALGLRALVTCVEGELHLVGAAMAATLLRIEGWEVDFLGADLPAAEIAGYARLRQADVVIVTALLPERAAALVETLTRLDSLDPRPAILVGGPSGLMEWPGLDAVGGLVDGLISDLSRVALSAREAAGRAAALPSLESYLAAIGERLQALRRDKGWSQQLLAERAGLDRSYVSAVERGRQNVSLGALHRLAGALGVSLEVIIAGH